MIIRQGEKSRHLWVVAEGKCEVAKHVEIPVGADGKQVSAETVVLAVLEPFSQFGEMSFFHPAPHSADVRAASDVKLFCISYGDYKDLIDEGVWAAYKLAHNAVDSLAQRLRRMDDWIAELLAHKPASEDQCANGTPSARSCSIAGISRPRRWSPAFRLPAAG